MLPSIFTIPADGLCLRTTSDFSIMTNTFQVCFLLPSRCLPANSHLEFFDVKFCPYQPLDCDPVFAAVSKKHVSSLTAVRLHP